MYHTYEEIEHAIMNNEEFKGSSASAVTTHGLGFGRLNNRESLEQWLADNTNGKTRLYVVYSYGTPMLVHLLGTSGAVRPWINREKYSPTTSRLQNIIKRVWSPEFAVA